ncbi:hypothetical protein IEO21_05707 [Rhodonia placenta]|uniref:RNA polymerase II-associated protein 1 C-terminal domain-containing protein n=1 Tax=Rhodonia placenta TaxID=104341 RepID=A0A8H7P1D5_9APHY|nr:hypothetical protein IEO21_05707 [Postia placenta]
MTEDEREEERKEILERFGPNVGDILHVTPNDIYVYESAPPSPRKKPLALLSPTDDDGPTISLGEWKSKTGPSVRRREPEALEKLASGPNITPLDVLEEGTPEDIRRRFFPTAPAHDPSLAWIETGPSTSDIPSSYTLRFDLTGTPISPDVSSSLPTHLGLHHHADGEHAGYTLNDVFLLSRSTLPAQRATMLDVLGRIARRLSKGRSDAAQNIKELVGREAEIRKRIMAAGVEAMAERGSVGARAVEVMWECIVSWDEDIVDIEGVELQSAPKDDSSPSNASTPPADVLSTLPLDYVLPQIASALATAALPAESLSQLLAILHRLAQHSNRIAGMIVTTDGLVRGIIQTFLLTPIPPTEQSRLPDPFALRVLATLALASRDNASTLLGPTDALLRFVITTPPTSPFPLPLASALLAGTLRVYAALALYGLYAHIATTAAEHLAQIGRFVFSEACQSRQLREAWLGLLETWMVCARDPHRTTPSHEILWSQVVSWGWGVDVLEMRVRLTEQDDRLWASMWSTEAAWLEGAKVNGVRGGESERESAIEALRDGFRDGPEMRVVQRAGQSLSGSLGRLRCNALRTEDVPLLQELARHSRTLAAVLRLWLSCLAPQLAGSPETPPFILPFAEISELCASLTTHPIWTTLFSASAPSYAHVLFRPISLLLSYYVQLSRRLPDTHDDLWMGQAFSILNRLLPGDEEAARAMLDRVVDLVTPDFMSSRCWGVPPIIGEKGGLKVLKPFFMFSLQGKEDLCIGPTLSSPASLSSSTTQRLPPLHSFRPGARHGYPLPLFRDWMFIPLDHLLRSGESDVFKHMPSWWDASETEVVRATLLFAKLHRQILLRHALEAFGLSREETSFACMKVFMLEHGQQQSNSVEEVFRDSVVSQLMDELIAPFAVAASSTSLLAAPLESTSQNLEIVAARFLGASTPFYQFYTDFVGLYDAISFAHPLFGRLLLPPLSMRYPLDYRKYLWADYSHVLKTVRTPIEDVITENVAEFLWPVETDPQVIGSYLRALATGTLVGFLRFVAVHHIACNIWPDLRDHGEEKANKLLQAFVDQAGFDAVREVVLYRQVQQGSILVPPHCYDQVGEWKTMRLQFIQRLGEERYKERLGSLLRSV